MPVDYPKPPYPCQKQPMPGSTGKMNPRPDHGETSYTGSGRLKGMRAVITGPSKGSPAAVLRNEWSPMRKFIHETNLKLFRKQLAETTDPKKRQMLLRLLAEE